MSESAAAAFSTRPSRHNTIGPAVSDAVVTLDVSSRLEKVHPERAEWERAHRRLGMFVNLPEGWDSSVGIPISSHTIRFAAEGLAGLRARGLPAPTINPGADGAIYAHWNGYGLDIELIFEGPYQVVALIEDDRRLVDDYVGKDPTLSEVSTALSNLMSRKAASKG